MKYHGLVFILRTNFTMSEVFSLFKKVLHPLSQSFHDSLSNICLHFEVLAKRQTILCIKDLTLFCKGFFKVVEQMKAF